MSRARVVTDVTNAVFKNRDLKPLIKKVFKILEKEGFWKLYIKDKEGKNYSDEDYKKISNTRHLCFSKIAEFIKKQKNSNTSISKYEEYVSALALQGNIYLYYLLTKEKNIKDLWSFIYNIAGRRSLLYVSPDEERIGYALRLTKHHPPEERRCPIYGFYLALKWFYSDKTKHLYTKNLLEQIKQYEEFELKNRLNIKSIKDSLRRARNLHVW